MSENANASGNGCTPLPASAKRIPDAHPPDALPNVIVRGSLEGQEGRKP